MIKKIGMIIGILMIFSVNIFASETINDYYLAHESFLICYQNNNSRYVNDQIAKICIAIKKHLEQNYNKKVEVKGSSKLTNEDTKNKNLVFYLLSNSSLLQEYMFPVIPIKNGFIYLNEEYTDKSDQLILLTKSPFNSEKEVILYIANSSNSLSNINQVDHGEEKSVIARNGQKIVIDKLIDMNWQKKETEHFKFFYLEKSYVAERIDYIAAVRENLFDKASEFIPNHSSGKISCYLYNNIEQKYSCTGTYFFAEAFPDKKETHEVLNLTRQATISTIHEPLHILLNNLGYINSYFIEEGIVVYIDKCLLKQVSYKANIIGDELNYFDLEKNLYSGYKLDNPYLTVLFIEFLLDIAELEIDELIHVLYITQGDLDEKLFNLTKSRSFTEITEKWKKYKGNK